jgi:hypothetical protein
MGLLLLEELHGPFVGISDNAGAARRAWSS